VWGGLLPNYSAVSQICPLPLFPVPQGDGAGFATNLYVPPDQFAWTSGQDCVVRHDLQSARNFSTTFCRECGAPLPHHTRSGHEIVVPAGSLVQAPDLEPQGHIFWDSRAPWTSVGDELPRFTGLWDGWSLGKGPE
jgi:hypothetical protein